MAHGRFAFVVMQAKVQTSWNHVFSFFLSLRYVVPFLWFLYAKLLIKKSQNSARWRQVKKTVIFCSTVQGT